MRIAVIGAGRVGTALGARWAATGHDIVYGVRDPTDPHRAELGAVAAPANAVRDVDAVLIALPWDATEEVLGGIDVGDAIVIDATNPIVSGARQLERHPELAGAQLVAEWARSNRVVKAFNTTGSANMANPAFPGGTPVMLIAGDDSDAKDTVVSLASDLGFDAVDAGPLAAARDLEHLAMIWVRLAYVLGNGPNIAFSLLRR